MRLVHYSHSATLEPRSVVQTPLSESLLPQEKPQGLWVSDEDDHGWSTVCQNVSLKVLAPHAYEITLRPDANVLIVSTLEQFEAFDREHASNWRGFKMLVNVDWHGLSQKYAGIVITPFRAEYKLPPTFGGPGQWYTTWDCASGVIWDVSAIATVTKIKEPAQ